MIGANTFLAVLKTLNPIITEYLEINTIHVYVWLYKDYLFLGKLVNQATQLV